MKCYFPSRPGFTMLPVAFHTPLTPEALLYIHKFSRNIRFNFTIPVFYFDKIDLSAKFKWLHLFMEFYPKHV